MSQKRKTQKRQIKSTTDLNKMHRDIWDAVRILYEESEGGVYINNFGYFCHVIKPHRKWKISGLTKAPIKASTNGYPFRHVLLEVGYKNRYYHVFRSISTRLRKRLDKLISEKRYKLRLNEVISYKNCTKRKNIVSLYKKKL